MYYTQIHVSQCFLIPKMKITWSFNTSEMNQFKMASVLSMAGLFQPLPAFLRVKQMDSFEILIFLELFVQPSAWIFRLRVHSIIMWLSFFDHTSTFSKQYLQIKRGYLSYEYKQLTDQPPTQNCTWISKIPLPWNLLVCLGLEKFDPFLNPFEFFEFLRVSW